MITTTKLYKHQEEAAEFIIKRGGSGALFHSIGTGKTRTGLEIFRQLRLREANLKLLVICPISLINAAWGADIERFTDFKFCNLRDGVTEADVYVINYEAFISSKSAVILKLISSFPFMCLLDESSKIKTFKAITTKNLLKIRKMFKYRIVASGTPAPNCETEYWPQMMFINDNIFLPSFYQFRNNYFHLERGGQKLFTQGQVMTRERAAEIFSKGWKYAITQQRREQLLARMKPYCHYAHKDQCLDLPEQVDEIRHVDLTPDQRRIYLDMKNHLIAEIKGQAVVAPVALAKICKLREITSGFCIDPEGKNVEIGSSPKITELLNLIEEIGDQPLIIWANFRWEIQKITQVLQDNYGFGCVETLYSETEDRDQAINNFKNGNSRFLVAHPRSASYGLTFVNCSVQVFFSLSYSFEDWDQCKGRTHRIGQAKTCVYIHLIARKTIDENILQVVQGKKETQDLITEFLNEGV